MVDPIKGCSEIELQNSSLLPTPMGQCMGQKQMCINGTQTFPISNLGGWKHSSASINCLRQTNTSHSNTLDKTDIMEISR